MSLISKLFIAASLLTMTACIGGDAPVDHESYKTANPYGYGPYTGRPN
jgi:hypothetical protein